MNSLRLAIYALSLVIAACTPPRYTYQTPLTPTDLSDSQEQRFRVLAAVEDWRDSGIEVKAGERYHIEASGRWRTYGTCNWTDADGLDLYNAACFKTSIFPVVVEGWNHSALIAKVGPEGQPFGVGKSLSWTPNENGRLYFRINDTPNANWDNEGHVDVQVRLATKAQTQPSKTKMPPALAVPLQPASNLSRYALVIGNSHYQYSPLKNPVNDAKDMAEALKQVGFEVLLELDANQQHMEEAIDRFARQLTPGSIALFYFAGHGVQVNGENYLIPVGADINRQSDVRYKAVNTGQVLNAMGDSNNNLNIIILDACRNNPLPRSYRSAARGLARMEGPKGTIFGFATSPGSVAADGERDNGLYTEQLLKHMQTPGLSIEQVFKRVLRGVDQATQGQQIPWTESSFTGEFSFINPSDRF
jgi:hypothetical protein